MKKLKINKKKYNSESGNLLDSVLSSSYDSFLQIDNLFSSLNFYIKNSLACYYKKIENDVLNSDKVDSLYWINEHIKLLNRLKIIHKKINYVLKRPYDDFKPVPQINHSMVCYADFNYLNKYLLKLKAYLKKYNISKSDLQKIESDERVVVSKFKNKFKNKKV